MSLLHYLSYVGAAAAFIFITLSLASGLLWLSELIEEHTRSAKAVGQRGIYAIIFIHIALYFHDSLPLRHVLFSIVCHIVYLQNFTSSWPFISLTSLGFIASCILVVTDHFIWFFHFAHLTQEARQRSRAPFNGRPRTQIDAPGFADIATFFGICVWLAPLFLFLSLSANDNALPLNIGGRDSQPSSPIVLNSPIYTRPTKSLFKSLYDNLPINRIPRLRQLRRNSSQGPGIIAPASPNLKPISPMPSSGSLHRVPSMQSLPPSQSSSPRVSSESIPNSANSLRSGFLLSPDPRADIFRAPPSPQPFQLSTPPRRSTVDPVTFKTPTRRMTGEGGLEMRRAVSANSALYDGGF